MTNLTIDLIIFSGIVFAVSLVMFSLLFALSPSFVKKIYPDGWGLIVLDICIMSIVMAIVYSLILLSFGHVEFLKLKIDERTGFVFPFEYCFGYAAAYGVAFIILFTILVTFLEGVSALPKYNWLRVILVSMVVSLFGLVCISTWFFVNEQLDAQPPVAPTDSAWEFLEEK